MRARRLDAVHLRHRDVHQDDVGPQRVRAGDRLDAVGRLADDRSCGRSCSISRNALRTAGVIVDDQNPERARRRDAAPARDDGADPRGDSLGRRARRLRACAARRDQADPRPLPGRAVDVEAAAEQRQPLADAEQPPADLAGLRSLVEPSPDRTRSPDPSR